MPKGKKQPCSNCGEIQSSPTMLCDNCRKPQGIEPKKRGRPKGSKNKPRSLPPLKTISEPVHRVVNPVLYHLKTGDRVVYSSAYTRRGKAGEVRQILKDTLVLEFDGHPVSVIVDMTNPDVKIEKEGG